MSVFFYPCNWCRLKEEELSMVINLEYSVKQLHPFGHQNTRKIIITQQYLLYTRTFRASASDILDNNGPTLSNCPTFEDVRKKLTQKRGVCLSVCVWCLFVSEVQPGVVKGLLGVLRSLWERRGDVTAGTEVRAAGGENPTAALLQEWRVSVFRDYYFADKISWEKPLSC